MQRRKCLAEENLDPRVSPLMKAILDKDVDAVELLLSTQPNLEVRDRFGRNALYHAFPTCFCDKSLAILKQLLDAGINVNSSLDSDGCSALVTAVEMNEVEVVASLLSHGVDVNEPSMSKFCGSLTSDHSDGDQLGQDETMVTKFFFSKGCEHVVTPLLCAVMQGYSFLAEMLLAAGACTRFLSSGSFWRASNSSVCSVCEMDVNPVHMAAYKGDVTLTKILLEHHDKSPPNSHLSEEEEIERCFTRRQSSYNDITPLWFALLMGHELIVRLLLTRGKPVAPPCHFGSGLQVCLQEGHTALALMILRAGYDLEDDLDWIESGNFPTDSLQVKEKIACLLAEPRPLLEWCCLSLRGKFGVCLQDYLSQVKAPKKICDVLTFDDLLSASLAPTDKAGSLQKNAQNIQRLGT